MTPDRRDFIADILERHGHAAEAAELRASNFKGGRKPLDDVALRRLCRYRNFDSNAAVRIVEGHVPDVTALAARLDSADFEVEFSSLKNI